MAANCVHRRVCDRRPIVDDQSAEQYDQAHVDADRQLPTPKQPSRSRGLIKGKGMKEKPAVTDVCLGLSGIDLGERVFEFGHGIQLRATFAHLFGTDILAFERPATPTSFHPGPWQALSHKNGIDILAVTDRPIRATHDRPNGATCAPPKRVSNGV